MELKKSLSMFVGLLLSLPGGGSSRGGGGGGGGGGEWGTDLVDVVESHR